ncbi:type II toxin-antitoxin system PemK/MazF family toxin [uncultured Flavobacterium sp.]|uniref:type II toxin-antitoxin system PemK/MazF family toxin n=1 Tax=uncultured Flavobacterium sp. TaxID=165435 RepID=UPI0026005F6A|nr:type II toxin-antitoxin system PemK/MazF family toxin [uncultured Flavobacterium sp.]
MVKQYEIYWVVLDPTLGSEINKIRPCLVISPDDSNKHLNTVLIAPITSTIRNFPMRLNITLEGKAGQIALDQLRCIDKLRIKNKVDVLSKTNIQRVKSLIKEYIID